MAQIGAICLYKHMIYIMVIFSHWRTSLALRQLSSTYLPTSKVQKLLFWLHILYIFLILCKFQVHRSSNSKLLPDLPVKNKICYTLYEFWKVHSMGTLYCSVLPPRENNLYQMCVLNFCLRFFRWKRCAGCARTFPVLSLAWEGCECVSDIW